MHNNISQFITPGITFWGQGGGVSGELISTPWTFPTTGSFVAGSGTDWSSPTRITANDNSYSTASSIPNAGGVSDPLRGVDYAWANDIPTNCDILGVEVKIRTYSSTDGSSLKMSSIQLVNSGAAIGTAKAQTAFITNAEAEYVFGSSSDTWGATLTPAMLNGSTFGFQAVWQNTGLGSRTAYVDSFEMRIHIRVYKDTINMVQSSSTNSYNFTTHATTNGWTAGRAATFNLTINSGVTVGSTSTATPALTVPSGLPLGSIVNITNNGRIAGRGGNGGTGGGGAGSAGGPALRVQYATTVNNTNGQIWGGGGGGRGGANNSAQNYTLNYYSGGGEGNGYYQCDPAGTVTGVGGAGGAGAGTLTGTGAGSPTAEFGGNGAGGSSAAYYNISCNGPFYVTGNTGSAGGGAGLAGGGSSPAAAGAYITGNSLVTWDGTGDRRGGVA